MVRKNSPQPNKIQTRFDTLIGDKDFSNPENVLDAGQEYAEQLKKIKARFTAITGGNYSFTPAILKNVRDRKVEIYFAYSVSANRKILRPYLKIVTDFAGGLILEFKNAYYSDFVDGAKYPLNAEFDAKVPVAQSVKEQMAFLKELQELYAKVRSFAFADNLSAEDKKILAAYGECLSKTVPAELLSFCRVAEPEFFDWAEKTLRN